MSDEMDFEQAYGEGVAKEMGEYQKEQEERVPESKPQKHTCYLDPKKQEAEHSFYSNGMCKAAPYTGRHQSDGNRFISDVEHLQTETTCDCGQDETIRDLREENARLDAELHAAQEKRNESIDNMNTIVTSLRKVSAELISAKGQLALRDRLILNATGLDFHKIRDHVEKMLSAPAQSGQGFKMPDDYPAGLDPDYVPGVHYPPVPARKRPCTRAANLSDRVGEICPYCNHTMLVHPGQPTNPKLSACAVCISLAIETKN